MYIVTAFEYQVLRELSAERRLQNVNFERQFNSSSYWNNFCCCLNNVFVWIFPMP